MSHSFRDSSIVVLDTGRTTVRAGLGLHDLLRTPSVDIPARVGLPRTLGTNGEDVSMNGEAQSGPSTSHSSSANLIAHAKVTDYLVGSQLDEALASGQDVLVFWPFANADIADWTQAEALWKYVLFNQLKLRRPQMESPVLLSIPPNLSRSTYERICQLFFERFNVAALGILDRPTAQFYSAITASSQLSGIVVDVDREWTDITPIYDGFIASGTRASVHVGFEDCKRYLAGILRGNQTVLAALSETREGETPLNDADTQAALEELAQQLWSDGLIKVLTEGEAGAAREADELGADAGDINIAAIVVAGKEKAVIESGMRKKAGARASAAEQARAREIEARDLVEVQWRGRTVTVGKERHRFCEPLFDLNAREGAKGKARETDGMAALPVQAAVGEAVAKMEVDQRAYVWQGLFVTGDIADHIKGLGAALQTRLTAFIIGNADPQHNEVQPRSIRTLKIPDYFAEYRDKGDGLASFLGTSIVAKITFNDSAGKNYVSKSEYASEGPKVILGMSPSLF
ncbi:actin-like ATPase domain-containing protein [Wolfiporia cocos MD-104 SS10]|uniref:Actin-like ATPase domain-containing protein n=1 Tax=Wolfiporia cocos (strain MD-104) TaxID=742152 RepID=A0A2H3JQF5_WOLCO|nr:actin-like ATPase domain-containing protein [Wolfiporia cocos MD-104 SS10]